MSIIENEILKITQIKNPIDLQFNTLGRFEALINGKSIDQKSWSRDKTLQLLQFLINVRYRRGLHKEQIINRLWEDAERSAGDRDFKVAMHGINKALEPNRKSRTEPKYIIRQGLTYQLNMQYIWLDIEVIERLIELGNNALHKNQDKAVKAYTKAIELYEGPFLPGRMYEDWCSEERERIQIIILSGIINLAQLLTDSNPMESIRLCKKALQIDKTWEDAYRIQMEAYIINGNRPLALRTFAECEEVLDEEFGIAPLPRTKALLQKIEGIS
ncbi:MAG: BTAD domain-containing putative transcriptional regulator [Saprospiraceae bacterium]